MTKLKIYKHTKPTEKKKTKFLTNSMIGYKETK